MWDDDDERKGEGEIRIYLIHFKVGPKTTVMCSMMFCKQMRLTYVMLALLRERFINIKMEPSLSFEQWKETLKWYWRMLFKFNSNEDVSTEQK